MNKHPEDGMAQSQIKRDRRLLSRIFCVAACLLGIVDLASAQPGVAIGVIPAAGPYTEPLTVHVGIGCYSTDLWQGWSFELVHDSGATLDDVVASEMLLATSVDTSIIEIQSTGFSVEVTYTTTVFPIFPSEESHLYEATYSVDEPVDVLLQFVEPALLWPGGIWSPLPPGHRVVRFLPPFLRGDANRDGRLDLGDVFRLFEVVSTSGYPQTDCDDAFDFDDDGEILLGDMWGLLACLFTDGADPPPPYPACGFDTTDPGWDCIESVCP